MTVNQAQIKTKQHQNYRTTIKQQFSSLSMRRKLKQIKITPLSCKRKRECAVPSHCHVGFIREALLCHEIMKVQKRGESHKFFWCSRMKYSGSRFFVGVFGKPYHLMDVKYVRKIDECSNYGWKFVSVNIGGSYYMFG